jgi:hypothetical protein
MIEIRIKKHADKTMSILVQGKYRGRYAVATDAGLDKGTVKGALAGAIATVHGKIRPVEPG